MLKSYSNYVTFTDSDGDFCVVIKSAITDFYQEKNGNCCLNLVDSVYCIPNSEFISFDSLVQKLCY